MKSSCRCCGREYTYYPSQAKVYCSNQCQGFYERKIKAESGTLSTKSLRRYLIERDIYECVICGNTGEWMGNDLPLQLDHIDGNPKNNNLNNVRWLCPNCHCQTDTWGTKNISSVNRHKLKTNISKHTK